ncbi:UNVERIFIED_CONTAM: hypothetical protein K2H54_041540 [Gekko kuhli]
MLYDKQLLELRKFFKKDTHLSYGTEGIEALILKNLQIKTLADDVRDRITSFRKSGGKKEKLLIQHPIDTPASINELPVVQPLFDERCMNLSEKEVMDLFEKMMLKIVHRSLEQLQVLISEWGA